MSKEIVSRSKIVSLHAIDGEQLNGDFNSDILFNFTDVVKRHSNTLYLTISIQSAEIPYSFYNVSENYNKIYYAKWYENGGIFGEGIAINPNTITIPEGNYTATTLLTEINNQFTSNIGVFTISSLTGKITLTPANDTFELEFIRTTQQHNGF